MIALNSIKSPHRSTSFFTSQNGRACFLWADLLPNSGWGKKELSHPWPVLLWNFLIRKSTFPPLGEIWEEKRKEVKKLLYWMSLSKTSEKAMAPHSSILAWKIPRAEEPGRLQSMASQRVGHNWVTEQQHRGRREIWGCDVSIHHDCGRGYMALYICQSPSNYTLKTEDIFSF